MKFANEDKVIPVFYLMSILASGLFYAYATTKVVAFSNFSPFIVLMISAVIDIIVFVDLVYLHKISRLDSRQLSILTAITLLVFFGISLNIDSIYTLLILFSFCSMMFSYHSRYYEEKILIIKKKLSKGLVNISLLRNLSKLFGFGIGAYIYGMSLPTYTILLFTLFLMFATINLKDASKKKPLPKNFLKVINKKSNLLMMALLSTTAVFWIPFLVSEYEDAGWISYSSLAFILPGVFSVLFLKFIQGKLLNMQQTSIIFLLLNISFISVQFFSGLLLFKTILLSCMIPLAISLNIHFNTKFMESNSKVGNKILLQGISISTALAIMLFSFLAVFIQFVPFIILMFNTLIALIYLQRGGAKFENRPMLS